MAIENTSLVNLADLNARSLEDFCVQAGEKSYRVRQLTKWIHQRYVSDFDEMTDLSKSFRLFLKTHARVSFPSLALVKEASDGTLKCLVRLHKGDIIETVFIPEKNRGTLCVSSQVGCSLNCSFCSTGKQGFNRNLTLAEIIGQLWLVQREVMQRGMKVTNVVMMGMGEPLLNFDPVVAAMALMISDDAYGLSKYKVTLSTSGLVPQMKRLSEVSPVALAVSLHAPFDDLRDELVPINKHYNLKKLLECCRHYFAKEPRRKVMFEYVMLKGVNDQEKHAVALAKLLKGMKAKVNLIPFNPFPGSGYETSTPDAIERFQNYLINASIHTTVRKTRGDDIDVACGQLVGDFTDKTRRQHNNNKNRNEVDDHDRQ